MKAGINRLYRLAIPGNTDVIIADDYSLPGQSGTVRYIHSSHHSGATGREINTCKNIGNTNGAAVPLIVSMIRNILSRMGIDAVGIYGTAIPEGQAAAAQLQAANASQIMGHPNIVLQPVTCLISKGIVCKPQNIVGQDAAGCVGAHFHLHLDKLAVSNGNLRLRFRGHCHTGSGIGDGNIGIVEAHIVTGVGSNRGMEAGIDGLNSLTIPGDTDVVVADLHGFTRQGGSVANLHTGDNGRATG